MSDEYIEGFALSGEIVLPLQDKKFKIIEIPTYEIKQDLDDKENTKKKLKCVVQLSNGMICDYYPNKTAIKAIMRKAGARLGDWINYEGEFFTERQKVGELMKDVVYVKAV